jgi:hypothetical protein
MWNFIKENILAFFFLSIVLWVGNLILTQIRYKTKGARLDGKVVGHVNQSGNYFPVYEFVYNGETLRVDSYNGEKNPMLEGEVETIYYLPGNMKGVFAERNTKIKLWQIGLGVACLVLGILKIVTYFNK